MLKFLPVLLITVLMLTGCKNENTEEEALRYHDDGRCKPVTEIVPVIETAFASLPWSLSEEFTSLLKSKINNRIFVEGSQNGYLLTDNDPFSTNIDWIKNRSGNAEFTVFVELVEYENVPIISKNHSKIPDSRKDAVTLNIGARIRIIDVRKSKPVIVLQEMIKDSYYMPNTIDNPDYNVVCFGTEEYKTSPLAIAHAQFIKQIATRVNDYILLAKER